jgi:hypothetical protein
LESHLRIKLSNSHLNTNDVHQKIQEIAKRCKQWVSLPLFKFE